MITKPTPSGPCNASLDDVSLDGARLDSARFAGRRILTGLLTGPNSLLSKPKPPPVPPRRDRRESPK